MNMISINFFAISIGAVTLTLAALTVSILSPQNRIWPPKHQKSWGQYFMLILFNTAAISITALGILDWGSYIIPTYIQILGFTIGVVGNTIAIWAMITLGLASTTGNEGILVRGGPYSYSRNPQYVGFVIGLIGWGLFTNSFLTLIASMFSIIPLVIVPKVEEPWLRIKYGKEYEEYMIETPRFFSWKR